MSVDASIQIVVVDKDIHHVFIFMLDTKRRDGDEGEDGVAERNERKRSTTS